MGPARFHCGTLLYDGGKRKTDREPQGFSMRLKCGVDTNTTKHNQTRRLFECRTLDIITIKRGSNPVPRETIADRFRLWHFRLIQVMATRIQSEVGLEAPNELKTVARTPKKDYQKWGSNPRGHLSIGT